MMNNLYQFQVSKSKFKVSFSKKLNFSTSSISYLGDGADLHGNTLW